MNLEQRWERSVAILLRYRELVAQLEQLPKVPIVAFLDSEMRRQYRRFAARLRSGKVEPRYKNLFTAEQLADICEAACARDELFEKTVNELRALAEELRAMLADTEAELASHTTPALLSAKDAAQWFGPDSIAEQRYREIQQIRRKGQRRRNHPPKSGAPETIDLPGMDFELHVRQWLSAAELLTELPANEPVLRFGDGGDGAPIVLRIGIAEHSWVGSFARGVTDYTTVQLMPDDRHLLVVANGAGYMIEVISNVLVAALGHDISVVGRDEASSLMVVDHGGTAFETFGPEGRVEEVAATG